MEDNGTWIKIISVSSNNWKILMKEFVEFLAILIKDTHS